MGLAQRITQRELRNDSGRVMRALEKGHAFIVTRNGVPVGELIPVRRRTFVSSETAKAIFAKLPRMSRQRFRKDVDAILNQDPTPRG